jgi:hypothetical protein
MISGCPSAEVDTLTQQDKNPVADKSDQLLDALHRLRTAEEGYGRKTISADELQGVVDEVNALRVELAALGRTATPRSSTPRSAGAVQDIDEEKCA